MKKHDSEEAKDRLREYGEELKHGMADLMELKREHSAAYELEKNVLTVDFKPERLGERIQAVPPGPECEQMIEQLKEMLKRVFDLKQKHRKLEAEQIERELHEIRELIKKRKENQSMIINRRLEDLIGRPDVYEW